MPKEGRTTKRTVTTIVRGGEAGDPIAGRVRHMFRDVAQLMPDGYIKRLHEEGADIELKLHVFKKIGPSGMTKVGEYPPSELDPETVEEQIVRTWGHGLYQFRLSYNGKSYPPSSLPFRIGETDEVEKLPTDSADGTDSAIALVNKRLGQLAVAKNLKEMVEGTEEGGGDMKTEQLTQLLAALKPDNSALVTMLDAANRRAEAAEQRNHELTMKMVEQRGTASLGAMPVVAELLKTVKPEVWQTLLSPGEQGTDWLGAIRDVVREVGPGVRMMLENYVARAGLPALPPAPRAAGGRATAANGPIPTATPTGGTTMPMDLNEEQQMSKGLLLEFLKQNDMANTFAVLAAFPGFAPGPQGPMPLGDFILSRIDPAANPRVYLPQLAMLFPETRQMQAQAVAFIEYAQKKIMADEEAMLREQRHGAGGDPEPTREGT
ncbi:MAG: hypothetical protein L0214_07590 [candidate division NC10 bacterium]|nr:hypothetical protein [candidate division NC10 bacterium]